MYSISKLRLNIQHWASLPHVAKLFRFYIENKNDLVSFLDVFLKKFVLSHDMIRFFLSSFSFRNKFKNISKSIIIILKYWNVYNFIELFHIKNNRIKIIVKTWNNWKIIIFLKLIFLKVVCYKIERKLKFIDNRTIFYIFIFL